MGDSLCVLCAALSELRGIVAGHMVGEESERSARLFCCWPWRAGLSQCALWPCRQQSARDGQYSDIQHDLFTILRDRHDRHTGRRRTAFPRNKSLAPI